MSYDIYIGHAELESEWPGDYEPIANWTVSGHAEDDAPAFPFDIMSQRGNSRHPGYTQWGAFCDEAGLRAMFFDDETGLMRRHPGTFPLEPHHLATVRDRKARWMAAHPNAIPGFDWSDPTPREKDDGVRGRDGILARLLWLEWWMDWALRTCERPAIHNH